MKQNSTDANGYEQFVEMKLADSTLVVYDKENPTAWIQSSEYYELPS